MKHLLRNSLLGITLALFALPFVVSACSDDEELDREKEAIRKLAASFNGGVDSFGDVYRVLLNYDREGYAHDPVAEKGDEVHFYFHLRAPYTQYSSEGNTIYSNVPALIDILEGASNGIAPGSWPRGPMIITYGEGRFGLGLDVGLATGGQVRLRQRDSILVLVPYDKVGDDHSFGIMPKETSVAWLIGIDTIVKTQR